MAGDVAGDATSSSTGGPPGFIAARPGRAVSRRSALGGALAVAGAGLLAACAPAPVPGTRSERRRVVVIGTGFGGAVTALRLAERGVDVTLVERGQAVGQRQ